MSSVRVYPPASLPVSEGKTRPKSIKRIAYSKIEMKARERRGRLIALQRSKIFSSSTTLGDP